MPGRVDEPGADDKTAKTDSALLASVQEAGQQAQQDRQQGQPGQQEDEQREVDEQEGQSPT